MELHVFFLQLLFCNDSIVKHLCTAHKTVQQLYTTNCKILVKKKKKVSIQKFLVEKYMGKQALFKEEDKLYY
jgi:hypothetical protein